MTQRELLYVPLEERLAMAQDPTALPERLGMLLEDWFCRQPLSATVCGSSIEYPREETEIVDALAIHPNTPPNVLACLAIERPAAFCRNPVAPLLPLEVPGLTLYFQRQNLGRLLREPEVPLVIVEMIATQSDNLAYRREAELHIALAGELGTDWRDRLRTALTVESRTSVQMQDPRAMPILEDLVAAGCAPAYLLPGDAYGVEPQAKEAESALRTALARHAYPEWNPDLGRCLALANPTTEEYMLDDHAESSKWLERLGVALNANPILLDEIMPRLAEDGNSLVRAAARARLRGETAAL